MCGLADNITRVRGIFVFIGGAVKAQEHGTDSLAIPEGPDTKLLRTQAPNAMIAVKPQEH